MTVQIELHQVILVAFLLFFPDDIGGDISQGEIVFSVKAFLFWITDLSLFIFWWFICVFVQNLIGLVEVVEDHFVGLEEELEEGLLNGVLIGGGSGVLFRDSLKVF